MSLSLRFSTNDPIISKASNSFTSRISSSFMRYTGGNPAVTSSGKW
nr:MAG TPA: hypothetical protein [Caudoviricetes sp.]